MEIKETEMKINKTEIQNSQNCTGNEKKKKNTN